MGLIPNLPPMDTPTIKPIVQLLCLWVRYLTASADETETNLGCNNSAFLVLSEIEESEDSEVSQACQANCIKVI